MSDSGIWWETLFLSSESLVGLAALTKGAYFEQLVSADTGGVLFEHFNNPNTDIGLMVLSFSSRLLIALATSIVWRKNFL